MRITNCLLAGFITLLAASTATAGLTVSAESASDLNNIGVGEEFTITVTVTTTGAEALALGLRAANYNDPDAVPSEAGTIAFVSSSIPSQIFGFDIGGGTFLGGLANSADGLEQQPLVGVRAGLSVNLFQGVSPTPAAAAGPDTFDVTFSGAAEGTTTIDFGAFLDYSDTYTGGDNGQITDSLTVTVVPEPGTVAASLAAMGSVLGVVAVRRRR